MSEATAESRIKVVKETPEQKSPEEKREMNIHGQMVVNREPNGALMLSEGHEERIRTPTPSTQSAESPKSKGVEARRPVARQFADGMDRE